MQPEKKMKRLENRELFQDFNRTIASVLFEENTNPWEVLPKIHDFIMEVGMLLSKDEYEEVKEHVWVAKSASGPIIAGPLIYAVGATIADFATHTCSFTSSYSSLERSIPTSIMKS